MLQAHEVPAIQTIDLRREFRTRGMGIGAGKTTLIKILTTLLAPTKGQAFVNGLDVTRHVIPIRQRIAMVSGGEQSGYGVLTVREQLWMFAQFYGVPSREAHRRIDELLVAFDLSNQASQKYTRFPQVCASASTSAVRWSQTRRSSSWMSQLSGWMWRRRAQCANTCVHGCARIQTVRSC